MSFMFKLGDIVKVNTTGEQKLIIESREEIIPIYRSSEVTYRARSVYRLAGEEYAKNWFVENDMSVSIPK
ncbi:MAG TPA: hypothetical protein EYF95_04205 [Flavobacteriales bacterium]|jgi:hypothetical protein|nr:hypothetical protein [Flavobacteriales bacterium]